MELTVAQDVRRAFALASLRRDAKLAQNPEQWGEMKEVGRRCADTRKREEELYAARYDTRVEAARRRLIDAAGARPPPSFKPWWAAEDRFSPAELLRQARREVRQGHYRRIARIDAFEQRMLGAIVAEPKYLSDRPGPTREAFARAADRRSGHERRRARQRER